MEGDIPPEHRVQRIFPLRSRSSTSRPESPVFVNSVHMLSSKIYKPVLSFCIIRKTPRNIRKPRKPLNLQTNIRRSRSPTTLSIPVITTSSGNGFALRSHLTPKSESKAWKHKQMKAPNVQPRVTSAGSSEDRRFRGLEYSRNKGRISFG